MSESPFIYTEPVIPPVFAGRTTELLFLNDALFKNKESIVLYGNDAIGKSSLISTIYTKIKDKLDLRILPVRINAFDFIQAVEKDFLAITTHQICAAIWTNVMNHRYSELLEESFISTSNDIRKNSEERTLKRIFRIVTNENISGIGSVSKELGGKFYLEGKYSRSNEISSNRKPLQSFEFLHLLDELNDIIKSYNYSSIMIFCDELNHLPEKTNTEIIRNYFGVFASRKIQFLITVVNPNERNKDDAKRLIDSFNYSLEIKEFQNKENVDEFLNNILNVADSKLIIEEGVSNLLFEVTSGHPWWIQKICDNAYLSDSSSDIIQFDLNRIESSSKVFKREIDIYNERIKLGLPFRKYDLK
ncbi:MAG: hypothetical protein GC181_10835 [Bacteroidetes bacterium]|nr:hypothetical protein [Bacteroidota bacterium]